MIGGSINGSGSLTVQRHEGRLRYGARGHHAARRRGAGEQVERAVARRPSGGAAVLRRARGIRRHAHRVAAAQARRPVVRARAGRECARDRVPARARARDPARVADLDRARCPQRHSRAQAHRTRRRPHEWMSCSSTRPARSPRASRVWSPSSPSSGNDDELLALAAAVEAESEHPIARAIVAEARERALTVSASAGFDSHAGRGAQCDPSAGARSPSAARGSWPSAGWWFRGCLPRHPPSCGAGGATVVYVLDGDSRAGAASPSPTCCVPSPPRRWLSSSVAAFASRCSPATRTAVGQWVAAQLGIDEVHAEVLPGREVRRRTRAAGRRRARRDGRRRRQRRPRTRRRPTSASRSVPARMSRSSRPASCSPRAIRGRWWTCSRSAAPRGARKLQNLFWATGYNAVGIPLAAGAAFGAGRAAAAGARRGVHVGVDDHRRRERAAAAADEVGGCRAASRRILSA